MPDTSAYPLRNALAKFWRLFHWLLEASVVLELAMHKYYEAAVIAALLILDETTPEGGQRRASSGGRVRSVHPSPRRHQPALRRNKCGGANVLFRNRFDLRFCQRGEICGLGGDDALKCLRMMGLQILLQEVHRAALARCISDEDDRFGMAKIRGYLLVVGFLLGNMLAFVMGFFAVDQMMLEAKGIIRLDCDFIFRPVAAEIVINMGNVMVDDHNHSPDLVCLGGFPKDTSFFEKPAQPGNLLDFEIMGAGPLEEAPLGTYYERKLIISVRLDLANLSDKFNYGAPTQIARQLTAYEALREGLHGFCEYAHSS